MIKGIYNAIARFLKQYYPEYNIYDKYPEQGFFPSCFVIKNTGGTVRNRISNPNITRNLNYLTFIVEFYSLDPIEVAEVINGIKVLMNVLDVKEDDYSFRIRAYNKRSNVNIAEGRGSFTFSLRMGTEVKRGENPIMNELNLEEILIEK